MLVARCNSGAVTRGGVLLHDATLVWLPLPLGSNREWAVGLFVALTSVLAGIWGVALLRNLLSGGKALKGTSKNTHPG